MTTAFHKPGKGFPALRLLKHLAEGLSHMLTSVCRQEFSVCLVVFSLPGYCYPFLMSRESSYRGSAVFCLLLHGTAMWSASGELGCFKTGSDHCLSLFCFGLYQRQNSFLKKEPPWVLVCFGGRHQRQYKKRLLLWQYPNDWIIFGSHKHCKQN